MSKKIAPFYSKNECIESIFFIIFKTDIVQNLQQLGILLEERVKNVIKIELMNKFLLMRYAVYSFSQKK